MQVGMVSFWQHSVKGVNDQQFVKEELRLAQLAEELGFDFVGMPEHHFEDYSMCVDNLQALSYLAGRTERIGLLTAVVVLPWHNPIRVAEKIILLDHLSDGRAMFGMGRGLAPKEYAAFGIDQSEAKDRFAEMAAMVIQALETGIIQGDGPYYKLPPTELRPRPFASFKNRVFGVANTPSSAENAAKVGAILTMNIAEHVDQLLPMIDLWRNTWRKEQGTEPPPPMFSDFTLCTRDPKVIDRATSEWYPNAWTLLSAHYGLDQVDFTKIKGYEAHANRTRPAYIDTQVWGTPEEIIERVRGRLELTGGAMGSMWTFRSGGMPYEIAEGSIRLFAKEALPELKKLGEKPEDH